MIKILLQKTLLYSVVVVLAVDPKDASNEDVRYILKLLQKCTSLQKCLSECLVLCMALSIQTAAIHDWSVESTFLLTQLRPLF